MAGVRESELLGPYVPRLLVDWLRSTPDARVREVEGSLAFVDISGFTSLTERLGRKGRVGAEEISNILDATFASLLSVAYEDGAGLVKWGGDAVLLLFEGPDHAARATHAAHRMRATMRDVGRLVTSVGQVTLRMSVGIHSGIFHFFLVGDPQYHRELLVSGPAASRTAEMEQIAAAGEIAVSPSTARLLPRSVVGRAKGDALLLRSAPAAAPVGVPPTGSLADVDLAGVLPAPIREHLLASRGGAEHRSITVAFVEFSGTDALLERSGPEALADALDECVRNVQEATALHEVTFFETDINRDGGKIMLTAGAPRSADHDEERMLRAARRIMDRIGVLPLRIGINRGGVFAGDFGPQFRRTFSVKGDAVNLAARVMAKAVPGQVLATTAVVQRSRAIFETEALPPFPVKGKSQLVEAVSVGPVAGARADPDEESPLAGREIEMELLTAALDRARARRGGIVELVGEPGIGKSRLMRELVRRADGATVVSTVCQDYESSTPYFAIRSLLSDLLGVPRGADAATVSRRLLHRVEVNAPELVPWLPLLGVVLDVPIDDTPETARLDDRFRKARLEEVVVEFLSVAAPTSTVLMLDDVHLMDVASVDLLQRLAFVVADQPWLLVLGRRSQDGGFRVPADVPSAVVRLTPLGQDAALAMLRASTSDTPLPPHVMDLLAKRAAGNPFFLRGLIEVSRAGGSVELLPDSVDGLLTSQIDRLPPAERTVLRHAAVLGVSFTEAQLRALLADEALPTGRESMRLLGHFLRADGHGGLHFRHGLIREVAYEGLPYRRRQILHGRVGDTLESAADDPETLAELLSLHFFHAGRMDKAWHYSRVAGDGAVGKYAHVDAVQFYSRAAAAARSLVDLEGSDLVDLYEALGEAQMQIGSLPEARAAFRRARAGAGRDRLRAVDLLRKEALVDFRGDRLPQSLRTLTRALGMLSDLEGDATVAERARLAGAYARGREKQGRYREAVRWGHLAEVDALAAGDMRALAEAYGSLHSSSSMAGYEQPRPYGRLALDLFVQLGDTKAQSITMNNLGVLAWIEGRGAEALAMFEKSRDAAAEAGDTRGSAESAHNLGDVLLRLGRLDDATAVLTGLLPVFKGLRSEEYSASTMRWLGLAAVRAGRLVEGRELVERARAVFSELGLLGEVFETQTVAVELMLAEGEWAHASALAADAIHRATALDAGYLLPTLLRLQGTALLVGDRLAEARVALQAALDSCQTHGETERGFILAELGRLALGQGDADAATSYAAESEQALLALGYVGSQRYPIRTASSGLRRS